MAKIVLNFGKVRNLEVGRVYHTKYELFDELFDGIIEREFKITVQREAGTYRKTCLPLDISMYLMGKISEYCLVESIGAKKLRIANIYPDKITA
jgi:hypothetical protein